MAQATAALEPARAELSAVVATAGKSGDLERRLSAWAKTTASFEPLGDAIFVPAVMCDLAGQLMVRGREAKLIKLDAKDAPFAFLDLPWDEALRAFQERIPTRKNELEKLLKDYAYRSDAARRLALETIQQFVKDRLAEHIANGGTYSQFAQDIQSGAQSLGITADDPSYVKMIFRTNIQSAYGAGKFRAITDPDVIDARPYVEYMTVGDARVGKDHAPLHRTVYLVRSEKWRRIAPPNRPNCRCSIRSCSAEDVAGREILGDVPKAYVSAPGFDSPPGAKIKASATRGVDAPADPIEVKPGWQDTPPSNDTRQLTIYELYNQSQARAPDGKWTKGGGSGVKIAPKKQSAKSPEAAKATPKRARKTAEQALAEIKARLAKKEQVRQRLREAAAAAKKKKAAASENPSAALDPKSEHIFGKRLTDSDLDGLFGKLPTGYRHEEEILDYSNPTHAAEGEPRVVLKAKIFAGDEYVGSYDRVYKRTEHGLEVHHTAFFVSQEHQGSGIGRSVFNSQIDAYKKQGVARVSLDAGWVGKYVWTKAGFEWTDQKQIEAAMTGFKHKLTKKYGAAKAKKIMAKIKTPNDIAKVVVGKDRIGKDYLTSDDAPDGFIAMASAPARLHRL